jgi:proteasome lid subunit RPN8/RPN11
LTVQEFFEFTINVFNYFEEQSKVTLHKYEKAVERNNEIILHFATHPRHRRCFPSPNPNLQPNYQYLWIYVMDAKVSHKSCPCPSFKIPYILLGLKPVQH